MGKYIVGSLWDARLRKALKNLDDAKDLLELACARIMGTQNPNFPDYDMEKGRGDRRALRFPDLNVRFIEKDEHVGDAGKQRANTI